MKKIKSVGVKLFKYITVQFLLFSYIFPLLNPKSSYALEFNLHAPTGLLTRGQEVKFTITVDTEGEALSTIKIGLSYDTQYLKLLRIEPGDTFPTITSDEIEQGKLIVIGNSSTPFSGQGTFAYAIFELIADAPGATQLCALFPPPEETPSPTEIIPTEAPTPTALLKSGSIEFTQTSLIGGFLLLSIPTLFLFIEKLRST